VQKRSGTTCCNVVATIYYGDHSLIRYNAAYLLGGVFSYDTALTHPRILGRVCILCQRFGDSFGSAATDPTRRAAGSAASSATARGAATETTRPCRHQYSECKSGRLLWTGRDDHRRGRADPVEIGVLRRAASRGRRAGARKTDRRADPRADAAVAGRTEGVRDRD